MSTARPPLTLTEKIVTAHALGLVGNEAARVGDYVTIRPRHVMTHDNTAAVMAKFKSIGAARIADRTQPVIALDHDVQSTAPATLSMFGAIEAFATAHRLPFFPAGSGIGHQLMVEHGFIQPGTLVVASDSHANMYGALNCLGTPIVRTDAAAIWATGSTWFRVPPVARVWLEGSLPEHVTGKDVIVSLCGMVNRDEVLNHAIEFAGPGVAALSIDDRLTIANMTTEWGALSALFPFDLTLAAYLRSLVRHPSLVCKIDAVREASAMAADADAAYRVEIHVDLSTLSPMVAGPNDVKRVAPISALSAQRLPIHKAYLLSCVNGRLSDLREAARVMRGQQVAPDVEFYLSAASRAIQQQAEAEGTWQALLDAGARPLPSGCGPCIGLGAGIAGEHETVISATNRNFKGRMGAASAQAYLASPAVVAASALAGYITGPATPGACTGPHSITVRALETPISLTRHHTSRQSSKPLDLFDGFPRSLRGRAVLLRASDLNTDGIYAGKWTYRNDLTRADMARVVFENYDPALAGILRAGDILVCGANFGCGSSREQAASALIAAGVSCVLAASVSATFERNAFNNGLLCIDAPEVYEALAAMCISGSAHNVCDLIHLDFAGGVAHVAGQQLPLRVPSLPAQRLIALGGVERMVAASLRDQGTCSATLSGATS